MRPTYVLIVSYDRQHDSKPSKEMYIRTFKDAHDKHVQEVQDDIDAGATYKSIQTFEADSISFMNFWAVSNPEAE